MKGLEKENNVAAPDDHEKAGKGVVNVALDGKVAICFQFFLKFLPWPPHWDPYEVGTEDLKKGRKNHSGPSKGSRPCCTPNTNIPTARRVLHARC